MSPGCCNRLIPTPARYSGSSTQCPLPKTIRHSRPGRTSTRPRTAAGMSGWMAPTIPRRTTTSLVTGNPSAAYTSQKRGPGPNLYTCSLVAVNVDTGKLVWYYQTSPHDTHDYDSAQTPILVNADFNGKPRKLVLTAARNGYFFVVDRTTGEAPASPRRSPTRLTGAEPGFDKDGHPVRIPAKDFDVAGALVSPANQGNGELASASIQSADRPSSTSRLRTVTRCITSPRSTRADRWGSAGRMNKASARWAAT